jgi:hypothetical protein
MMMNYSAMIKTKSKDKIVLSPNDLGLQLRNQLPLPGLFFGAFGFSQEYHNQPIQNNKG